MMRKKNDDPLFKHATPDVKKLRAQAKREIRTKERKAWKASNGH